ncbi:MAG: hypothetical protein ACFFAU_02310 [Candidatus Hodarchaeota archaeon]
MANIENVCEIRIIGIKPYNDIIEKKLSNAVTIFLDKNGLSYRGVKVKGKKVKIE